MSFLRQPPLVLEIISLLCLKPPKQVVQSLAARPTSARRGEALRMGDILKQHGVRPSCNCARLPVGARPRRSVVRATAMDRLNLKEVVHGVAL